MRASIAALAILAHASLISATDLCAQQAKSSNPTPNCNPIHFPARNEIVEGGKPYNIRWENNTGTSVSFALCQGPSTNCQEIGCIVDHALNTGSFIWTPSTILVPHGDNGYGLKIIADTGDFQWSDPFGISNSISKPSSSSTPSAASAPSTAKAIKESTKATKGATSAVKPTSSGQIRETIGTVEVKTHHTKSISKTIKIHATSESKTHSKNGTHTKTHKVKPSATGKHLSAHLVHHVSANATHNFKSQGSHILPSVITTAAVESATSSGAESGSVTQASPPTVAPSGPATLPATTVAPPATSLQTSFSAGGAVRAAVTGVPLVLGAMAAFVL